MRVLITGASGFIGKPLLKKLNSNNCKILALSRNIPKDKQKNNIVWLKTDLASLSEVENEIENFSPEVVIHLAWQDIPDYSYEKSLLNLNLSLNLFSFLTNLKSCKKVLVSGSCWEYNKTKGECIETEQSEANNQFTWAKHSIYSWLKLTCEQKNISLGWFRVFYVYGPEQKMTSLLPTIFNNLKLKKIPSIRTPKNSNDFIFIEDVVEAFAIATMQSFPSGIYNLGSGKSISVLDICKHAEKIILGNNKLSIELEEATKGSSNDSNFWANIDLSRGVLNWEPQTGIVEGISKTWDSIRIQ